MSDMGLAEGSFEPTADSAPSEGLDMSTPTTEGVAEGVTQEPDVPKYTVKVDGQEIEVTLDELRNGYSRQQDYTRKTQELAAERARLAELEALRTAMDRDPIAVVKAIADAYGLDLMGQQGSDEDFEPEDPVQAKLREFEEWKAQQEAREVQAQIDRTVDRLKGAHGEFNENELFAFAVQHRISDLDVAYRAWNYERVMSEAAQLKQQAKAAEDAKRTDAKRAASVVSGGAGTQPGSTKAAPKSFSTMEEAWNLAKAQLGIG